MRSAVVVSELRERAKGRALRAPCAPVVSQRAVDVVEVGLLKDESVLSVRTEPHRRNGGVGLGCVYHHHLANKELTVREYPLKLATQNSGMSKHGYLAITTLIGRTVTTECA